MKDNSPTIKPESKTPAKPVWSPRLSAKKRVAYALAVLLFIGVIFGGWSAMRAVQRHQDESRSRAAAARRHALIQRASRHLDPKDVKQLKPFVDQIKQEPNYTKDQSYMYILLTYSINRNDSSSANTEAKQLQAAYRSDANYDNSLKSHIVSQDDLKQTVDFLHQQAADTGANVTFGGSPL